MSHVVYFTARIPGLTWECRKLSYFRCVNSTWNIPCVSAFYDSLCMIWEFRLFFTLMSWMSTLSHCTLKESAPHQCFSCDSSGRLRSFQPIACRSNPVTLPKKKGELREISIIKDTSDLGSKTYSFDPWIFSSKEINIQEYVNSTCFKLSIYSIKL